MLVPVADTRTRGFSMPSVRSRAVSGLLRSAPELMGVGGFAVLALVLFWKQWFWNIQDWDEARHIVSAYEMLRSGDWIVNTYRGLPDYWNLKPPLSFWTIAASMKVFGFSPLAMRLPSILATLGTAAVSYGFVRRYAGRWAATCTVFVIATCAPLLNTHTGRTADPDAVYILALTVAVTSAINAMSDPRWLLLATTAFSAAFLTKSWHALLVLVFTAGVATALRIKRRLGIRHLLLAACGFLPLLTWAALRYAADGTKFFVTMVQYDLLSRTSTTVESHTGTGTYYIDVLQGSFGLWLAAGAFGIAFYLAGAQNGDRSSAIERRLRRMLILLLVWVVLVFGAFSAVPTKLWW
jgi:4-amino-4-deoxy-L-arabinose transferase-like glycosyltransferase